MRLARLHRRLVSGMALAALVAYAAGGGVDAIVLLSGAVLALSLAWLPPRSAGVWVERVTRYGALAMCAWLAYSSVVLGIDFMPGVIGLLLFLVAGEALRPLEARNDMRLYSLSFALLIAATAYYPGPGFALGFVAYVGLSVLGMMTGYLRRESERFRAGDLRVGRGFLWTTAALSLLILTLSAFVFVLFPRLPRAWNVQGRRGEGDVMAGFSDEVGLGQFGGRIGSSAEVMFRVEFPDRPPANLAAIHWRGRTFTGFDGTRWTRSVLDTDLQARDYARRWGGPFVYMRIFGGPPGADVLFGPHPVLLVEPRSAIRVFRTRSGDLVYGGTDNPVYTVVSTGGFPTDAQLRAAESPDAPPPSPATVALPELDPRVWHLADSLTRGATTRIDQVRAVERWLNTRFTYTLDLPATARDATVEGFLFRRKAGHCEYFSTAMAVLLRARGIPVRNVNGFLGGEWNESGRYLAVTAGRAHSWVEVWFPEWGWVPFDPTPPGTAEVLGERTRASWLWGARLWMDGVEYRWYKWVVDYNLQRQLSVFRGVGALFSRGERTVSRATGRRPVQLGGPWLLVAVGVGVLAAAAAVRRRRAPRLTPEARAYLRLRRAYAKAGWAADDGDGPLAFAETLARAEAPGADAAARAVDAYLRLRFSPSRDESARRALAASAADAQAALRRAPRPRTRAAA